MKTAILLISNAGLSTAKAIKKSVLPGNTEGGCVLTVEGTEPHQASSGFFQSDITRYNLGYIRTGF